MFLSGYRPRYKRAPSGFTLTELLIVVTIVGVLASLIVASYPRALESSRNARCIANLRQIGAGLLSYVNENNGMLVPAASLGGSPQRYWFDELNPYMGEDAGADFTSDSHPRKWQLCPSKPVKPENRAVVGYGWNHRYFGYTRNDASYGPNARLLQVTQPSRTIIIADSMDFLDNGSTPEISQHRYLYSQSSARLAARHSGQGNYLMLDGHVTTLLRDEIGEDSPTATTEGKRLWRKTK